ARAAAVAGLERAPRCHEFRRSLTMRMMSKGASIREISATLRHALLSTTLEYALELGGEAKAMSTLGSLTAAPRTSAEVPAVPAPPANPAPAPRSRPSREESINRRRRFPSR
ncbi:MAG: tyrosine-type recombinase/integrase, partial [Armatimonadota bacterium]